MPQVVCLGILVADVYGKPVDEWPERGRLAVVDDMGIGLGGCAANTGQCLIKLGVDTAIMGKVGNDGFGRFCAETLQSAGADVSGIVVDPAPGTSASMVMIDSAGERTFLHYPGMNGRLRTDELDFSVITNCRIFHCAGALVMGDFDGEPMAECLRRAQEAGVTTALDTVYNDKSGWLDRLAPCLRYTDVFLPSLAEAQKLAGVDDYREAAARLLETGPRIVGIKRGEHGSYVRTPDTELHVPAYPVEVLDGTGAGDAFVAGFLRGMLEDWDLERTAKFGNAVGGLCTTGIGTTAGVRDFAGTLAFLAEREPGYWGG